MMKPITNITATQVKGAEVSTRLNGKCYNLTHSVQNGSQAHYGGKMVVESTSLTKLKTAIKAHSKAPTLASIARAALMSAVAKGRTLATKGV